MPAKLSNSENVQALLKLTEEYNNAASNELEGLMLDIRDLIDEMSLEESYAYHIRLIAKKRGIAPAIIDLELELECETDDIGIKLGHISSMIAATPERTFN